MKKSTLLQKYRDMNLQDIHKTKKRMDCIDRALQELQEDS